MDGIYKLNFRSPLSFYPNAHAVSLRRVSSCKRPWCEQACDTGWMVKRLPAARRSADHRGCSPSVFFSQSQDKYEPVSDRPLPATRPYKARRGC